MRILLLLLITTSLVTSCKKGVPKQTKHIPKNAVFVATINTRSLQNKLMKSEATIENILKSVAGNDTSAAKGKQEWEDLKQSGIDLGENFYLAVVQKGSGMSTGKGSVVITGLATLKDAKKLEAYIKKKQPASEVRKEKSYSYTTIHGDNMIAWADDLLITMSYQNNFNSEMEYDSTTHSYNFKNPVNAQNDMKTEMDNYFNLKEDQSVTSIPEFRDLMQDKSDGNFWINSSSSMENIPLPLPKLKELLANSFTAATVNFEDGKIAVNSKSYYSSELRDLLKKYSGSSANLDPIVNYPSNNINGFGAFSFNPEFFLGIVNYMEVGGIVDGYLTKMMGSNYTLADALKAIKGDFSIVVSDFSKAPVSGQTGGSINAMIPVKMIATIAVGDKVQMNRLMDKLVEMKMMVKTPLGYSLNDEMRKSGFEVTVDDKNIYMAKDEALLNQYKSKSAKAKLPDGVMDDFKDKSGVMYVNVDGILNGIPVQNNQSDSIFLKAKETFKDMKGYVNNFNGKFVEGHYELRFKNEKENSLTSLLGFMQTASKNVQRSGTFNRNEVDSIPMALPDMSN
jgi:hypothetical protein